MAVTFDRAEALLVAGLANEARTSLEARIDELIEGGYAVDTAEWHLTLAHAALGAGDAADALTSLGQLSREFRAQRRPRWACLRDKSRSGRAGRPASAPPARQGRTSAHAKLWTAGWQVAALHCLLVAGRVELDRGQCKPPEGI